MHMVTFTKKKIKRITAAALLAAAAAAVGICAVITSTGTQAAERLVPIYSVERGDKAISLTFDVAWENSNTDELIEILDEYGAKATFFITGDWCDRYPEDVKKFYDAGHEIANHSDTHPHVLGMNVNDLISDTKSATLKIKDITGSEPTLYRAPYGEYDNSLITTIEGMGMKVIQWDVDSIDWEDPTADEITERVVNGVDSGSIVLFHNDLENTSEALTSILEQLKNQGYSFVTVSELVYPDDYTIDANGRQIPAVQSGAEITADNIEEVFSQYSDRLHEAGFTDEQMSAAVQAVKSGADIPQEVYDALSEYVMLYSNGTAEAGAAQPAITAEAGAEKEAAAK